MLTSKIFLLTILLEQSLNQDEQFQTSECSLLQSDKWTTFAFYVLLAVTSPDKTASSSSCSSGQMPSANIISNSFFQLPLTIFSFNRPFLNKTWQSLSDSEQTYSCQTKDHLAQYYGAAMVGFRGWESKKWDCGKIAILVYPAIS